MLRYEVSVDFGDNALNGPPKLLEGLSELGLYLETIPSMLGLEANGQTIVKIKTIFPGPYQSGRPSV